MYHARCCVCACECGVCLLLSFPTLSCHAMSCRSSTSPLPTNNSSEMTWYVLYRSVMVRWTSGAMWRCVVCVVYILMFFLCAENFLNFDNIVFYVALKPLWIPLAVRKEVMNLKVRSNTTKSLLVSRHKNTASSLTSSQLQYTIT